MSDFDQADISGLRLLLCNLTPDSIPPVANPCCNRPIFDADLVLMVLLTGVLFFTSGAAALFYQIAWQRTLFGWYGVDLDSVSVIVSIFMLGLGIGAIVGGWLADHFQFKRILVFSLIELTIAIVGLFSLNIIDFVGAGMVANSLLRLVVMTFLLFLIPTCAMGATLPVLVTELVARTGNVGLSTGNLYFANTLGAAIGALIAGLILIPLAGLDCLIQTAVALNLAVSSIAFLAFRRLV